MPHQVKNLHTGDAGHMDLIPGSGRSPGGGNGNPSQHSCLESPKDRRARWTTVHGVTKSPTGLSTECSTALFRGSVHVSPVAHLTSPFLPSFQLHLYLFFLAMLCSMQVLSSLTRDGTCAPCCGSLES